MTNIYCYSKTEWVKHANTWHIRQKHATCLMKTKHTKKLTLCESNSVNTAWNSIINAHYVNIWINMSSEQYTEWSIQIQTCWLSLLCSKSISSLSRRRSIESASCNSPRCDCFCADKKVTQNYSLKHPLCIKNSQCETYVIGSYRICSAVPTVPHVLIGISLPSLAADCSTSLSFRSIHAENLQKSIQCKSVKMKTTNTICCSQ